MLCEDGAPGRSLVAIEVPNRGDREGEEPSRDEESRRLRKEVPLEVVGDQDEIPRPRRERVACEIREHDPEIDPGGRRPPAREVERNT